MLSNPASLSRRIAFWKANFDPTLLSRHKLCLPRENTFYFKIDPTFLNFRVKVCIESPWELVKI